MDFDGLRPTIFHEEWWLDAATNGCFKISEISESGKIVGRLPYQIHRKYGMNIYGMPPATPYLGPAVAYGDRKGTSALLFEMRVIRQLLANIPSANVMRFHCHRDISNVLVFQESGFRTNAQFTFEIQPDAESLQWANIVGVRRSEIKTAEKTLKISTIDDPDIFIRFYCENIGQDLTGTSELIRAYRRIIAASLNLGRGKVLAAIDDKNMLNAAIFLVWDTKNMYYLISSRSKTSTHGSIAFLIWNSIRRASVKKLTFDFSGVGNVGGLRLYKDFGGEIKPIYTAVKSNLLIDVAHTILLKYNLREYFY